MVRVQDKALLEDLVVVLLDGEMAIWMEGLVELLELLMALAVVVVAVEAVV